MGLDFALGSSALLPAGLGFRNVLINGDFRVWQRGTSITVTTGSPYTADRWCVTPGGTANFSASRQTASLDGFQYCLRLQRTASNTNTSALYLSQPVETVTSIPLANKQVSFSFYARAGANFSAASSALNVRLVTGTGTDGNYLAATLTGQAIPLDTTATLTTSFQRFTYSVFVPSGVNQVQPVFFYTPVGTAGANDYFDVTGVQLEQNYSLTPFEQRPIGVELALCQRYYYVIPRTADIYSDILSGGTVDQTTYARYAVYRPVMRTESYTLFSSAGTSFSNLNASGNQAGSTLTFTNGMINLTSSGLSTGQATVFRANNNATAFIALSTEL